jgi:hypothetical protein
MGSRFMKSALGLLLVLLAGSASAQLTVTTGPFHPGPIYHAAGTAEYHLIAHLRLSAQSYAIVASATLTLGGTGDWDAGGEYIEIWLDNGDGFFDASLDMQIGGGRTHGNGATFIYFVLPVLVAQGTEEQLWIRVGLTSVAGVGASTTPQIFTMGIAEPSHLHSSVPVTLGASPLKFAELRAFEFPAVTLSPLQSEPGGGAPITIQGSGFMTPFSVRIGGVTCPGVPLLNANGTEVTGLSVPAGVGTQLPIVIESGSMPPQTLSQRFSYTSETGTQAGLHNSSAGGCSVGASGLFWQVSALAAVLLAWRRRNEWPLVS